MQLETASRVSTAPLWGSVSRPPEAKDAIRCRYSGLRFIAAAFSKNCGPKASRPLSQYRHDDGAYRHDPDDGVPLIGLIDQRHKTHKDTDQGYNR